MKYPVFILPLTIGLILSGTYLLPKAGEMSRSAISMDLPQQLGSWQFHAKPPSEEEIKILADDTEFAKAVCLKPRPGEYDLESGRRIPDRIDLSVVLSGHDLNNSIHRPERCMPAQGHTIGSSTDLTLDLPNGKQIPVRRLLSVQAVPTNEAQTEFAQYQSLTYYFFVGHHNITQDHISRTLIDMKDRLLYGMDQRWAYVSASMWYGEVPWIDAEITLEEADEKLQNFLTDFSTEQIDWKQIN